jgi:hypothetical protein
MTVLDNVEAELRVGLVQSQAETTEGEEMTKLKTMVTMMGKEQPLFAQFVGQPEALQHACDGWNRVLKSCSHVLHNKGSAVGTKVTRHRLAQLWQQGGETLAGLLAPEGEQGGDVWVMV